MSKKLLGKPAYGVIVDDAWNGKETPFKELLSFLCGTKDIPDFTPAVSSEELDDEKYTKLVEWVVNSKKIPDWVTGSGIIDAIDALIIDAIENENLKPQLITKPCCVCGKPVSNYLINQPYQTFSNYEKRCMWTEYNGKLVVRCEKCTEKFFLA